MAGSVAAIWANLRLNISDFSSKLATASKDLRRFAKVQAMATKQSAGYGEASKMLASFNRNLSDTANITRGIVISQAFYAAVGTIRDATSALWNFNVALDYMNVTYTALFGSKKIAEDFMAVLQEHSIETIFDYQGLADASKKLLAYGIEYENLMFIMEGLTNLGAMSGDSAALDRIALALGQIYTKGKLSAEEMRQLANAYIPITEILQDKFGLSGDDLKRVGDLNLPAADVINAIVDYANENFGSVGDAAMYTITGLQNRIVDTLKVVGASMMQPLTNAYKSFLAYVSEGLESIRSAYEAGGVGGVFEFLVPDPSTQQIIRQFLANVHNLFMSLASVGKVVGQVLGNVASVVANAFNILSPLVLGFVNVLSLLISRFLSTEFGAATLRVALVGAAAAFVLLKVQALGALVITAVTKAVNGLSKALLVLSTIISKHPIVALLVALAATAIGVSAASNKANFSISGLFDTISGAAGGTSSDEVLQRVNQTLTDSADAADQFNNRLKDSAGAANDLSKAISGAGKEAKKTAGLLSFDEVFKLPEQNKSSGGSGGGSGGLLGDLENLAAGFNNLGGALIPEIPDFSEFASKFTDNLFGSLETALSDKVKNTLTGAGIGGILGFIIGAIFKNPKLGMWIGTAVGGFGTFIWQELEGALTNTGVGGAVGVWTALSNALSKAGATVGLGTIVKQVFKAGGLKGVWAGLAAALKNGGWKAIAKGGIIGTAVGLLVDGVAHLLWTWLDEEIAGADAETAKIGQTIGSLLGTVIGAIIGGPAGALIGSAIGTLAGGLVGLFEDEIKKFITEDLGLNIGTWIGQAIGGIALGPSGAASGAAVGTMLGDFFEENKQGIIDWATDTGAKLSTWWTDTKDGFTAWATDTGASLSAWWTDTKTGFTTWWTDTKTGFSGWWTDTTSGFTTWWEETKTSLQTWWDDTVKIFSDWDSINGDTLDNWWADTKTGFETWVTDTGDKLDAWWTDTTSGFSGWFTDTKTGLSDWWSGTKAGFDKWTAETKPKLDAWWASTKTGFSTWATETLAPVSKWWADTKAGFETWKAETYAKITGWVTDVIAKFVTWRTNVKASFDQWKTDVTNVIGGFLIAAGAKFNEWFTTKKEDIKKSWNSMWDINTWKSGWDLLKGWFDDLLTSIKNWFTGSTVKNKISEWWSGLWNDKEVSVTTSGGGSSGRNPRAVLAGHASGGIFNREHIARFAEGNKAEAIIPLENRGAMQPFVDAVSSGIVSSLAPIVANINAGGQSNLPPLYVGTLIADDRGLKELYKKFEVIQLQENDRRGLNATI